MLTSEDRDDLRRILEQVKGDVMERREWRLSTPMTNSIIRKSLGSSYGTTGIDILNGDRSHFGQIVVFNEPELAEQIITEHNQHAALVEQRDRLVTAAKNVVERLQDLPRFLEKNGTDTLARMTAECLADLAVAIPAPNEPQAKGGSGS